MSAEGNPACPGYMLQMIEVNRPPVFVPMNVMEDNGKCRLAYETDTHMSLVDDVVREGIDAMGLRDLLRSVDNLACTCGEFLLDADYVIMEPRYIYMKNRRHRFIFNPFEKKDFNKACREMLSYMMGNQFNGFSPADEKFRERFLREVNGREFSARRILSIWDDLVADSVSEKAVPRQPENKQSVKKPAGFRDFLKLIGRPSDAENKTVCLSNPGEGLCLTGICSINTRIPVNGDGVTIGRAMLQKEYGMYNSGIGKTHARVYERDGGIYAVDQGSRNGTYVNGERLEKRIPYKIEKGDIIAFSDEEFILC